MKKLISVIIPVFNEEPGLQFLYQALLPVLKQISITYNYELIFVDDGSKDNSWNILQGLASENSCVRLISFSRNFGHQIAIAAGYDSAQGDAIITMDADLQHPPSLLPSMIAAWEQGFSIVYARRITRKDPFLKKIVAYVYYKILNSIADVRMPRNINDFRLIDRRVLEIIQRMPTAATYWRGMVAWTGLSHTYVDFKQDERIYGVAGYTWKKSFKLGLDGITSFSLFPLEIAAYVGVFVVMTGSLMLGYITYDAVIHATRYPLFKWLVTVVYIFMGVQFVLMWFVGEYIGRIYKQQKQWPLYIVAKRFGYESLSYEDKGSTDAFLHSKVAIERADIKKREQV